MHKSDNGFTNRLKKHSRILLLAGALLIAFYVQAAMAVSWQIIDTSGDVGSYSAIALDASGSPRVSYYDATNADLKYAYKDSEKFWKTETVDSGGSVGQYTSIAIDSSERVHISYYDFSNADLKYAYKEEGGAWQTDNIIDSGNTGLYTSIALDGTGKPSISYYDATNGDLKYAYKDANDHWKTETVDSGGDVGPYTSLAVDTSGKPYIAYYDATNYDLKYAYKDGGNGGGAWHIETVDNTNDVGKYASIALDASNRLSISYYDDTTDDLKCAYKSVSAGSSAWQNEVVDSTGITGLHTSVDVNASGRPYISYYDDTNHDFRFAYKDANNLWQRETLDGASDMGKYTGLAVDTNGKPHVSYYDDTSDDLKYIHKTAPMAVSTDPVGGTTAASRDQMIKITFDEPIQIGNNYGAIKLERVSSTSYGGGTTTGLPTANNIDEADKRILTIDPASDLAFNTTYKVTIPAGAVGDASGDTLGAAYTFTFTVQPNIPPTVTTTNPANGASVPVNTVIYVTFSEQVLPVEGNNSPYASIAVKTSNGAAAIEKSVLGNVLTIKPQGNLANNANYTVTIPAGAVKDKDGNILASPYSFGFTTVVDTTAPTVSSVDPVVNASNVPVDKTIIVTFSENVQTGSNIGGVVLKNAAGAAIATPAPTVSANTMAIKPTNNLAFSTQYTLTVPAGAVKDSSNNASTAYSYSFTTQADTGKPVVTSTSPYMNEVGVPINKTITVTFNRSIETGSAYGNIQLIGPNNAALIISKNISGSTLTVTATSNLSNNTRYTLTLPVNAVQDTITKNGLAAVYNLGFTTGTSTTTTTNPNAHVVSGLKATATAFDIALFWDKASGVSSYNIYRKEGSAGFGKLNTNPVLNTVFIDTTAKTGITYTYYVAAVGSAASETIKSNEITAALTIVSGKVVFGDVAKSAWYKTYVDQLVEKNVLQGYPNGAFQPNKTITRAEFAKALCLAMEWRLKNVAVQSFTDVPTNNWAYPFIQTAIAHGVVGGYNDYTYKPSNSITRAEIAKIIAMTLELPAGTSTLSDIKSSWAKGHIDACVKAGIISGYPNGTFKPGDTATRAEAAKMIVEMLKKKS